MPGGTDAYMDEGSGKARKKPQHCTATPAVPQQLHIHPFVLSFVRTSLLLEQGCCARKGFPQWQ